MRHTPVVCTCGEPNENDLAAITMSRKLNVRLFERYGLVEPFLLQLYSEMAHDCTRGSWTCFESRGIPNWTPAGGYTTPSQSIVPLHVKWMLVWEDPVQRGAVVLCKATPRSWLGAGETISVSGALMSKPFSCHV